jgi:hypothetical protein
MTKKLALTFGCLMLLGTLSSVASADVITFSFYGSLDPVHANNTGFSAGPGLVLLVSDSKTPTNHVLVGTASVSTGAASSYVASGGVLNAQYSAGTGVEVEVRSKLFCAGGAMPGVCLQGSQNSGQYVGTKGGPGSFQAVFQVDYVSPNITSLFGDPNLWLKMGSDSLDTGVNVFGKGGKDVALLTGGNITFQTPVPEPGTLGLIGSGLVGLAATLRRKIKL